MAKASSKGANDKGKKVDGKMQSTGLPKGKGMNFAFDAKQKVSKAYGKHKVGS